MKESTTTQTDRVKKPHLLIIGTVLTLIAVFCAVSTFRGYSEGQELPYAYSLTFLFVAVMLFVRGLYVAFVGIHPTQRRMCAVSRRQACWLPCAISVLHFSKSISR